MLGLELLNGYGSCVFERVSIGCADVIKLLWNLCWWDCSYWWGWSDQNCCGSCVGVSVGICGADVMKWLRELFWWCAAIFGAFVIKWL